MTEHPITPPRELVQGWYDAARGPRCEHELAAQAAQWGADQELELCANWLADPCAADMPSLAKDLRYSRRPKPPSLAEEARGELDRLIALISSEGALAMAEPIRRALEHLQKLEGANG